MTFLEKLQNHIVILDGGMGNQLQAAGLQPGELPEYWNIQHPGVITDIHRRYLAAGADVVYTNTFGANSLKYGGDTVRLVEAAVGCARAAAEGFGDRFVALDVGPTGKLLRPLGDLDFDRAVEVFRTTIAAGAAAGADLIAIETMSDIYEMKAALLAAREVCDLPVIATCVFGADGKMMTGADAGAAVALMESLGASAIGLNCSLGPDQMVPSVKEFLEFASVPVVVKPNAGLPRIVDGAACYDVTPEAFARAMGIMLSLGVRVVGGCCGTTPAYIAALAPLARAARVQPVTDKGRTVVSSYTHAVAFGGAPVVIGERINPTGKKRLQQALREGDMAYLLGEAVAQADSGADILDVNVGLPGIDERETLRRCVTELQAVTDLPLQIDTADPAALEDALRVYNGRPLLNSVSGKQAVMDAVFPLAKKYGAALVALTLDDSGIPATAQGRVAVADRILAEAKKYGIGAKDLIFDTLCMAVSADPAAPAVTLEALETLHRRGLRTGLGVSNVSFGLPHREQLNAAFFTAAMTRGLSAAIINPGSRPMAMAHRAYCALMGYDESCLAYIAAAAEEKTEEKSALITDKSLGYCIEKGLQQEARAAARELLQKTAPLEVVNGHIVPALDRVGRRFEDKSLFLPQLLLAAEAASGAFQEVKAALSSGGAPKKTTVVLATVRGDIHDIGKNIVKTLLENYGFPVIDLGKDVMPQAVVDAAVAAQAPVVGLSALMTTTVGAVEETLRLLREQYPACRTVVGGAVINEAVVRELGADCYGKDAMATVRFCEEVEKTL